MTVVLTLGMNEGSHRGYISMNDVARLSSRIYSVNARILATEAGLRGSTSRFTDLRFPSA
ncbi:hypothetical protein SSCG_02791 [Streptomyces clavuligerus]|nr:hypothetical protein SSCG_02791 [Streptomyces clavuligerus]